MTDMQTLIAAPQTTEAHKFLNIKAYPSAIESAEIELVRKTRTESDLKIRLEDYHGDFEVVIDNDKKCTNDQSRKAKKAALMKGVDYRKAREALAAAQEEKALAAATLTRLKSELRILLSERE